MISQTAAHRLLNSVVVIGRALFAAPSVFESPPVFMHRAGESSSNRFLNFCFGALVLYMISVAATPLYVEAVRDLLVRVPVAEALCD